jgi:CheY-like chemotaxis protein
MEYHILLADDDLGDQFLFKEVLSELHPDYFVHTVINGMKLMEYLNEKETTLPDVLFLDLNMPLKNGIECLAEIRSNLDFDGISITIYSTSHYEKDIIQTWQLGANRYLSKPNDYPVLKEVLAKALSSFPLIRYPELTQEAFLFEPS